jgi:hypothetical protein
MRQQSPRDINEAAGKGERVHRWIVHDPERPGQAGALRRGGDPRAELLDVALPHGILIQPDGRNDRRIGLTAHRDFLILADQHQLILAGGGIDGAAARRDAGEQPDQTA